jgi:cell wall-associated NlpC family hydrolase
MTDQFETYIAHAIQWARARLGSEAYPFRCLAFVEDAYERANRVEIFGGSSAAESAEAYAARSHREQLPPRGAFVFYECSGPLQGEYKDWGHVGLCVGEGQVIHAWDLVRQDHYLDVEQLSPAPGWSPPRYIGWTAVERIFVGYQEQASAKLPPS